MIFHIVSAALLCLTGCAGLAIDHRRDGGAVTLPLFWDQTPSEFFKVFTYISVGTPPQKIPAIVDTGSNYLVLMTKDCGEPCWSNDNLPLYNYGASSTFTSEYENLRLNYGFGSVPVIAKTTDTVALGSFSREHTAVFPSPNSALRTQYTPTAAGILGLGWNNADMTPLWQQLFAENKVADKRFGITFKRQKASVQQQIGELVFGGVNNNAFEGSIKYMSATIQQYGWWQVPLAGITANGGKLKGFASSHLAIVDSGHPSIVLAPDMAGDLHAKIPGARPAAPGSRFVYNPWTIPCNSTAPIAYDFGSGGLFTISAKNIVGVQTDEDPAQCVSLVGTNNDQVGAPFVLGVPFLTSVYSAYQYDPPAVGFATLRK